MSIFDFAWLIPLIPLLAFVTIALFTHRNYGLSQQLATLGVMLSSALALILFFVSIFAVVEGGQIPLSPTVRWFTIGERAFALGVQIDPLNAVMLFALALACLMILVRSERMWDDPGDSRFPAVFSLLTASVLGLMVFDNLLVFFILWEIVDVGAYLSIGFRRERRPTFQASLRAFLMAKVGSLSLLLGLVLLYTTSGSLAYADVLSSPDRLEALGQIELFGANLSATTVIAVLFLVGVVVKSGQFPFHTLLPETAEAPAPASALIHVAATAAGPFLLIRAFPLLDAAAASLAIPRLDVNAVTLVGVVSAALAAFAVITQRDIRRALSFATVGQLGYVLIALGMGTQVTGVFHLITGMFVNALLFLTAGAVSKGMGRAAQQAEAGGEQVSPADMLAMGGLGKKRLGLFWAFFIGAVALAGLPLATAGFWSKDAIIVPTWANNQTLFWTLAAINSLITFGAIRLVCLIFIGKPRTPVAEEAPQHIPAMGTPLVILAAIVLFLGWAGKQLPVAGGNWLASFLGTATAEAPEFNPDPVLYWSALNVGGLMMSILIYGWIPVRPGEVDPLEAAMSRMWLGWLHRWTRNGFYVDRLYRWVFVTATTNLGRACGALDRAVSSALVRSAAWLGRHVPPLFAWVDTRILDALVDLVGRAGRAFPQSVEWLDTRWSAVIDLASPAVKQVAQAGGILDRWWDRLVSLTAPGALRLVNLSVYVDKGLDLIVNGVGRAVETSGAWLRPKSGKAQSYLQMASITILVLIAIFLFLFLQT